MAERLPLLGLRRLAAFVAAVAFTLAPGVAAAQAAPSAALTGWLGTSSKFPARDLVLFPPVGTALSPANVHVTENGNPVGALTVTPAAAAGRGDFGLEVVVDQSSSMRGAATTAAFSAVRSLARLRSAQQELGMITFAGTPRVSVPLSSSSTTIAHLLALTPRSGSGANVPAAMNLALGQLARAKLALGAIVVVSDGVGVLSGQGVTPTDVRTAAVAARVPIITVGLKDPAASAASMSALAKAAPGQFVSTTPARLGSMFKQIDAAVTRGYVIRWHSAIRKSQAVSVAARVDGLGGVITGTYTAPAPPSPAPRSAAPAPAHPAAPAHRAPASQLSSAPGFALTPVAPGVYAPAQPAANNSFWASSGAVPVIAGICGLLFALAMTFLLYRPSRRAVRMRVGSFIPAASGSEDDLGLAPGQEQNSKGLLRMIERRKWWPPFALNVEISRDEHTPVFLVKRAAAVGVVLALLVFLLSGTLLFAFLPLLAWPFVLRWQVTRAARKQRFAFQETLPGYLQDLASAMRVGRSFIGALTVVADTADQPTKGEFERILSDEVLGRPLDESMEAVAQRMEAADLDQVALIAALNKRSGSNVAEALDRVAEGARERADLRREVRALTAQAKMSSWVLTSLPGVLFVGLMLISPLYAHPLLHTTLGLVLLGVGAVMVYSGWKVMSKITEIKV